MPKEVYNEIHRLNKSTINHLKKAVEKIEKRMQEIVKANEELHQKKQNHTKYNRIGTDDLDLSYTGNQRIYHF